MRYVVGTLLGLTLAALFGVLIVALNYRPDTLPLEIAKACLNVITLAVVVQAITFIIAQSANARQAQEKHDEFRRQTLTRLHTAFTGIKGLRRRARSQLVTGDGSPGTGGPYLDGQSYQRAMNRVNILQLDLELLAKDIETSHGIFSDSQAVYIEVSKMEEYLNSIVNEWEDSGSKFKAIEKSAPLSSFQALADLLGDYSGSQFRPLFVHSYYQAGEKVRASLTDGKSLKWKVALAPIIKLPSPAPRR
jgi:hypothetical protein